MDSKKKNYKKKQHIQEKTSKPPRKNEEKIPEKAENSGTNFEQELNWCLSQLYLGLKTQKPDEKQKNQVLKHIQVFESKKSPLIKKRVLMQSLFGDYRKKMEFEKSEKNSCFADFLIHSKPAKIEKVSEAQQQMKYFRKAQFVEKTPEKLAENPR
eukprot:Sdes_comp9592_c0_seq1m1075